MACLTRRQIKTCNYKLCKGKFKINITTNCDNLTIKWDLPITPHMKMNCCCHVFIMTLIMLMSQATNDGSRICQH